MRKKSAAPVGLVFATVLVAALTAGCASSGSQAGASGSSTSSASQTVASSGSDGPISSETPASSGTDASETSGTTDRPVADVPSIWYVNPSFAFKPWQDSSDTFKRAATEGPLANTFKPTVVGVTNVNIPQQITDIDQAVISGAQGVVTCDLNPVTFKKSITGAQAKGVVVVNVGCVDDIADYSVGTDNVTFGEQAADVIVKNVGPDAKIAVIGTDLTIPNQVQQYQAFKKRLEAKYPQAKILTYLSDNSDSAKAAQQIESLPVAYPDVNALWIIEGNAPAAVPTALKKAGKKPGDIFVLGIDGLPPVLAAVKDGWISQTMVQCYFYASPFAVRLIQAKLAGHGPEQKFWPIGVDVVGKDRADGYAGCPESFTPTGF